MRFGTDLPEGFLTVFSVGSEEEAQALLVLACETNLDQEFIARELATDQSMENLIAFGKRLETIHRLFFQFHWQKCDCVGLGPAAKYQVADLVKIVQLLDTMTSRGLLGLVGTIDEVDSLPNGHFNYYVDSHYMHEEELEKGDS